MGVCRLGEARAGPAGGLPPKRGWRTQIFKNAYPQNQAFFAFKPLFFFFKTFKTLGCIISI